ncbi:MAG: hypothetical protein J6Q65_05630, partial [Lentisphaeria bacterium]|nr:hypothetical protein [Lentisphaeria bacterium]
MALIITDEMWREVLSAPDPQYYTGTAAAAFARLEDHAEEAGFTGDEMRQLAEVMAPVSADPEMLRIWYRIVQTLSGRNERADQLAARMSGIAGITDPYGFNLLVVLGLVPFMEQLYREMGWYDELWTEALLDIRIWMDFCRENNDAFGISFAFPWIRHQSV